MTADDLEVLRNSIRRAEEDVRAECAEELAKFKSFAHAMCDLFFDDGGGPVEYDEFIEAATKAGVVVERPFNPNDPLDQELADEWGMQEGDVVYVKNFT